ncbi:hypothetical protein [Variovorax arabinosiphilus]|uniref:hypothetical protein n=1 Tax=Variovorax arabinosiphilus TaxID=3053498 RepID=UPI0025766453|nr:MULTISPECIES: hypothetical protein [unclassified Variovorax]MDM0118866.1 hypothetical protein [Variovorax sp. J2L1-78]MDM0129291.1 hypothetical protein [Variovorax sp. J2L1-63]MDM0232922.1 hypothetical protein [Variovorax sp. J2R1-6]
MQKPMSLALVFIWFFVMLVPFKSDDGTALIIGGFLTVVLLIPAILLWRAGSNAAMQRQADLIARAVREAREEDRR